MYHRQTKSRRRAKTSPPRAALSTVRHRIGPRSAIVLSSRRSIDVPWPVSACTARVAVATDTTRQEHRRCESWTASPESATTSTTGSSPDLTRPTKPTSPSATGEKSGNRSVIRTPGAGSPGARTSTTVPESERNSNREDATPSSSGFEPLRTCAPHEFVRRKVVPGGFEPRSLRFAPFPASNPESGLFRANEVSTNSPGRIRTAVNGSKGHYDWPLHHGTAAGPNRAGLK